MKTVRLLLTICILLTLWKADAQWATDTAVNTLVANTEADDMQALGTSTGMTYVVFWKPVAAPTNYELRIQVIDEQGNTTLGAEGALVSDAIPMSTFTSIWKIRVDANDHLYIGVTGTGGGDPAFVFKMDTNGNHLWNSSGVAIGTGNLVTPTPLSDGGVLVGWLSSSGGVIQRLDNNGTAVWPSEQPIEITGSTTAPMDFVELANGDYIAVFHEMLTGINSYLYAQRYDTDGNPTWANPVQLVDKTTAFNRTYPVIKDENTVFVGYYGATGTHFDSFLQRVNDDGSLPWGINGSDFDVNVSQNEIETYIAPKIESNYVWSICRYTDNTQGMIGTYVQKFNKDTGARELGDGAKEVFSVGSDKAPTGTLQLLDGTPFFVIKEGVDNGASPVILNAVWLDNAGDFAWTEEIKPLATFSAAKGRVAFTQTVNAQSVTVFVEDKGDGSKIYAQNYQEQSLGVSTPGDSFTLIVLNPVKEQLQIKGNEPFKEIRVYDLMGRLILQEEVNETRKLVIPAQVWGPGMYILQVDAVKGASQVVKLLKQ